MLSNRQKTGSKISAVDSWKAGIVLESTFAQTVNTGSDYHVFLAPEGECRGLYVTNKSATGFEVHELGGGQSNVAFSYRIVALRRGFENQTAMVAKVQENTPKPPSTPAKRWTPLGRPTPYTPPPIPANHPFVMPTKAASVSASN